MDLERVDDMGNTWHVCGEQVVEHRHVDVDAYQVEACHGHTLVLPAPLTSLAAARACRAQYVKSLQSRKPVCAVSNTPLAYVGG